MSEAYTERISNERCPECGKNIKYSYITAMGKEFQIECSCITEKKKRQRKQTIANGYKVIRAKMRELSGLKTRQQQYFIYKITPRDGQEAAFKAAIDFIHRFSENIHTTGLMFFGGVGIGKTLLSSAIANAVIDAYPISENDAEQAGKSMEADKISTPVCFASAVELLARLRASLNASSKEESAQAIMNRLKRASLLILDDIGAHVPSAWANERIFEIIDHRYNENLPVILSTNSTPEELKKDILDARIVDRLREMCISVTTENKSQRITAEL